MSDTREWVPTRFDDAGLDEMPEVTRAIVEEANAAHAEMVKDPLDPANITGKQEGGAQNAKKPTKTAPADDEADEVDDLVASTHPFGDALGDILDTLYRAHRGATVFMNN